MSRGFSLSATVSAADELTVESFADQLKAGSWLTGNEQTSFLNAAVASAQVLVSALPGGPFRVTISGIDRSLETNEASIISTTVMSDFTHTDAPAAPVETPAEPAPTPLETTAPPVETPAPVEVAPEVSEPQPNGELSNG